MFDPELTKLGYLQARHLRDTFPNHSMKNIDLVLCSPSDRTIHTALVGFRPVFERGVRAVLWSELREWGDILCNLGRSKKDLEESFEYSEIFDTFMVQQGWELGECVGLVRQQVYRQIYCVWPVAGLHAQSSFSPNSLQIVG